MPDTGKKNEQSKKVEATVLGAATKVPPKTVMGDDFEVEFDGITYHPHAGETVVLFRGMGVAEVNAYQALFNVQEVIAASEGDDDAAQQTVEAMHTSTEELRNALANRIVSWTWTDFKSQPMPEPSGNPDAFLKCTMGELVWLVAAIEGETATDSKNALSD